MIPTIRPIYLAALAFMLTALCAGVFVANNAAVERDPDLPPVITTALHDAAASGNPLAVDSVVERMTRLFPGQKAQIELYVAEIVDPATQLAAVIAAQDEPRMMQRDDNADELAALFNGLAIGEKPEN